MVLGKKIVFLILMSALIFLTVEAVRLDSFSWDPAVTRFIQDFDAEKIFGPLVTFNDRMGILGLAGVTGLAVIVWLWLKGWRAEAVLVALVGIIDFLNPVLRFLIGRPRPAADLVLIYGNRGDSSFPSGTAMHVLMFSGILIYIALHVFKPAWWRTAICILLGIYVPIMGLWLVYRGVHWTSDVLGGYLYGAVFLWVIILAHKKLVDWQYQHPSYQIPFQKFPIIRHMTSLLNK